MVATTFISPSGTSVVDATWVDGSPELDLAALRQATGWESVSYTHLTLPTIYSV